jgi:UDP-glucose 4-epimerase
MLGEDPRDTPNNIFPLIANTALGIQENLKIYGNDWPTPDGTPIRDYIHVMDLAFCHIKVLEFLMNSESDFLNLNIGTGIGNSVLDLVKTFERVNNVKVPFVFDKRRIGDAPFIVADNSLLISKMNINPFRSIEDMCRDGWKWKKLNPNGF